VGPKNKQLDRVGLTGGASHYVNMKALLLSDVQCWSVGCQVMIDGERALSWPSSLGTDDDETCISEGRESLACMPGPFLPIRPFLILSST